AARELAKQRGRADALSFDMGGTTAKAGLLLGGRVAITHNFRVGRDMSASAGRSGMGVPLLVPVVDVAEVGTGGGSIAWVDEGGLLRVGPRGAGSLHAARIAASCGMREIVVPPLPGLFSGVGLLVSDRTYETVRTRVLAAADVTPADIEAIFAELQADAAESLGRDGIDWQT